MASVTQPSPASPIAAVRSDHACFGCGDANPIGLHLQFTLEAESVRAQFAPQPDHQGFDAMVHGGIISTILDEAMAWAVTHSGVWTVTAEMRVRFRRPLRVGHAATVFARVTENRGRLVLAAAEIVRNEDSKVTAEATGTFFRMSEAQSREWERRYLDRSPVRDNLRAQQAPALDDDRKEHR